MIFREVEDRDLIAKARRGNVEAYNLLISRWDKRIFNYLYRLVKDREDAMDLVMALRRLRDGRPEDGARFEIHVEKMRDRQAPEPIVAHLRSDAGQPRWHWQGRQGWWAPVSATQMPRYAGL